MKQNLLQNINNPTDLKKLEINQLPQLAKELRKFIIDIVSQKEGHLGASLGVIELTIALHYVFNTPTDELIWDVGHQAYGHKILTNRKANFHTYRELNGISGFPKRKESEYDSFGVGHSSTAISAALGMALASQIKGEFNKNHIAVVGDASIVSGMAFEGLNHAGVTDANLLVILNDNAIGIDPSVGAFKNYLTAVKNGSNPVNNNIITSLNLNYSGPIDGHNLEELINELSRLKLVKGPKFLHITTTKGKGLQLAEEDQVKYHAPGKFNAITGKIQLKDETHLPPKFQDVFGITLVELAKNNPKIIGITPAMPTGSSMKIFMEAFPERAFDVGIAEQHAVTLSAGMATQGMIVYCNIYSTFLQRAYDQVIHDVALQNLPVIFCLDRAGLVGEDGATHHGVFDLSYLNCIPNLTILAPINEIELRNCLYSAQINLQSPIAIRYPRGRGVFTKWQLPFLAIDFSKINQLKKGSSFAIFSTGFIGNNVIEALKLFENSELFSHYHFLSIKPINKFEIVEIIKQYQTIITLEDNVKMGGFGSIINTIILENYLQTKVINLGILDNFIDHGTVLELQKIAKIDVDSIVELCNKLSK